MSIFPTWRTRGALVVTLLFCASVASAQIVGLERIGGFDSGLGEGAAEISAYDAGSSRLFVVNAVQATVDILDLSTPATPTKVGAIDVSPWGAVANSVDAYNGLIVVAVEASPKTAPGKVVFFDSAGSFRKELTVGALPDMVGFSPNGQWVVVANEGEPADDYAVDPEGSVSVIDLAGGLAAATVTPIGFSDFNLGGSRAGELPPGVRVYGPNATVAQDLEPEYVAFSGDSRRAYVTLQENNAIATIDLVGKRVEGLMALGYKNHALPANRLDPSDRDGGANLATWPVFGLYQPDAIATYVVGGQTLLLTANEGDARAYDGFSEEERVGNLTLDPGFFPQAATLQQDTALGRLRTTSALGDVDGDGDFDRIFAYGARSFSIWHPTAGLVSDSGSTLEEAMVAAGEFLDSRSDDKGPEPEGIAVGDLAGRHYAFVGLERTGGVAVYDITNALAPAFVAYAPSSAGDESPEGIELIPAAANATGDLLLAVAHEVSGTVAIYRAVSAPHPTGPCVADATTLCLNHQRFSVQANYKTSRGEVGVARAQATTGDTGYFYFFDEGNVELVVKALDACALFGHYWVFVSGLTNVEVSLTVTDTQNGTRRTYTNPQGMPFQPIFDFTTFATCP